MTKNKEKRGKSFVLLSIRNSFNRLVHDDVTMNNDWATANGNEIGHRQHQHCANFDVHRCNNPSRDRDLGPAHHDLDPGLDLVRGPDRDSAVGTVWLLRDDRKSIGPNNDKSHDEDNTDTVMSFRLKERKVVTEISSDRRRLSDQLFRLTKR